MKRDFESVVAAIEKIQSVWILPKSLRSWPEVMERWVKDPEASAVKIDWVGCADLVGGF